MKNKKFDISEEVAQEQLDIVLDLYDIYPEDMEDDDQKKSVKMCCSKMIKGIRKGKLTIEKKDDSIVMVQTVGKGAEPLNYSELGGSNKLAMDKEKNEYGKMYALVGSLTGVGGGAISKLKGADLSLAEAIGTLLFLA